jgi:hypothetical protein
MRERLLPKVISGASAGSIMCGVLGTHTDAELRHVFDTAHGMRLDFIKPLEQTLTNPVFQFFSGRYDRGIYRTVNAPPLKRDPYHPDGICLTRKSTLAPATIVASTTRKMKEKRQEGKNGGEGPETKEEEEDEEEEEEKEEESHGPRWVLPPLVGALLAGPFVAPLSPFSALKCDTKHLADIIRKDCNGDLTFQVAVAMIILNPYWFFFVASPTKHHFTTITTPLRIFFTTHSQPTQQLNADQTYILFLPLFFIHSLLGGV